MIQEWQQTGRDDDFLLRGFDLVPGVEVCTRRTLAAIQEGAPIQEISWLDGPGRPRPKAIGPEMKGLDVSFAATANRWRVLRCDVITKVITSAPSGAVHLFPVDCESPLAGHLRTSRRAATECP
jgi:hypothetical protein